jgi:NADPH:quinone reductase-like Zn-dependent oxidoreductase
VSRGFCQPDLLPRIDQVFAFEPIAEEHRVMEQGRAVGKLVVRVRVRVRVA